MPVTRDQALTASEFHCGECACHVGPRGGKTTRIETWRRNGATKTWKREPTRFYVPIKFGLRDYGSITEGNAGAFHVAEECPLRGEG